MHAYTQLPTGTQVCGGTPFLTNNSNTILCHKMSLLHISTMLATFDTKSHSEIFSTFDFEL